MILDQGDVIIVKALNNPGFVCGIGTILFFNRNINDYTYECSLTTNFNEKRFVTIKHHQIINIYSKLNGTELYRHDRSDAL